MLGELLNILKTKFSSFTFSWNVNCFISSENLTKDHNQTIQKYETLLERFELLKSNHENVVKSHQVIIIILASDWLMLTYWPLISYWLDHVWEAQQRHWETREHPEPESREADQGLWGHKDKHQGHLKPHHEPHQRDQYQVILSSYWSILAWLLIGWKWLF